MVQILNSLLPNSDLKKIGKTTRPFRYDISQIPYDYTVEVRNRFKGLDLIDRVPDELWNEVHDIVQETGIKTMPMEKKCKKAKWLLDIVKYFSFIYCDDHMVFVLCFVNVVCHFDLWVLNHPCVLGMNLTLSWCMIFLMWC